MKSKFTNPRSMSAFVFALSTSAFIPSVALAVNRTWDNGAANLLWSDAVNWDGDATIPASADTAIFAATGVGNVSLGGGTQTISALSLQAVGYTISNGTLSLNTINNTFPNGTIPVISANVSDQSSGGLTINQSSADCTGFTMNGQIAIANAGATALQVTTASVQRTGTYTLGSTTLANSVAGGVAISSMLNNGIIFQGTWNITNDFKMTKGSGNDNGGTTRLTGTIAIGGNMISAPTASGNSNPPCGIDIAASSNVSVTGNLLLQSTTSFAPSIRILQPLKLGGNINAYNGVLGISVTDPFLTNPGGVADTAKVIQLGEATGSFAAAVSMNANNKTLSNPITVASGSLGTATLLSTATGTGVGNKVTFAGPVTLNKSILINASNTAGAILDVSGKLTAGTGTQSVAVNSTGALAGTVALSNASNDYTGGTTVSSGVLQVNALGALAGSGRNLTVYAPGSVGLGYVPGTTIQSELLSRIVSTSTGAVALTANTGENFDFSAAGNNFSALSLGAVGSVTYTGTLTPNGTTYRLGGGGGTLVFTPGGGTFDATRDLVINGNGLSGTVDFGGLTKTFGAITVNGGTLQNGTLNCNSYSLLAGTVTATINDGAGSSSLTKSGGGTMTFSGSAVQGFTGGLIVNAGTFTENFANLATPTDLINAGNVLTLGGGTLSLTAKNNVNSSQTFASTTMSANRGSVITLAKTGTGTMTVDLKGITRTAGNGSVLRFSTIPDTANTIAKTTNTNTNDILGPWAVVGATTTLQYATVDGSNRIVNYTGATPTTSATDLSNMTSATTNYSWAKGGGLTPALDLVGHTLRVTCTADAALSTTGGSLKLDGLIGVGSNRTVISGTGNLVIGDTKELVIHWTVGFSSIGCPIVDNPGGASSVVINIPQAGEFDFQGAKSYTGGTTINAVEQLNFNVNSFGSGPITVNGGVRLSSRGAGSLTNNLTLNGPILLGGTYGGPITLVSTSSGNGATITGDMSGAGGFSVFTTQTTFSGTNTYTGPTSITSSTGMFSKVVSLYNADTSKWTPANISVNSGATLRLAVGGAGEFSAAQVGTLVTNLTTGINNNGLKAGSTLYLDPRNAGGTPVTISTNITDSTGPGGGQVNLTIGQTDGSNPMQTVVLSGANTYSGKTALDRYKNTTLSVSSINSVSSPMASSSLGRPTTVADGTINFGNGGDTSTGVLLYTGSGEITDRVLNSLSNTGNITLDQSGSNLLKFTGGITGGNSSRILTLQGSTAGTGEISGAIAQGVVTKTGTGTWTLSGSNSYSGITTVSQGKLVINGTHSGTGALNVSANATLGGKGTVSSNTTIANNGKLTFNLSTVAASHDKFDITGTLTFTSASTLDITATGVLPAPGIYTLVTTTGGITGAAPATLNLPSGWAATTYKSGDNLSLLLEVTSTGSAPEIAVEDAGAINIPDGGSKAFGTVINGSNTTQTFTIKNTGTADLTGLTYILSGSTDFSVTASPTAPVSGPSGTTTFTVQFAPTSSGLKNASIAIANNDSDENPFDINFSGTGISAFDSWATVTHGLSGGNAAFDFDNDNDGIPNGMEWILGGNPTVNDNPSILPTVTGTAAGGLTLVFNRASASIPETTLTCEWNTNLNSPWNSIPIGIVDVGPSGINPTVDIDAPSVGKVTVNIPAGNTVGGKVFARLKATKP